MNTAYVLKTLVGVVVGVFGFIALTFIGDMRTDIRDLKTNKEQSAVREVEQRMRVDALSQKVDMVAVDAAAARKTSEETLRLLKEDWEPIASNTAKRGQ